MCTVYFSVYFPLQTLQGGIMSEQTYPYCSGFGKCFPCQAPGYNKTRCGPPAPYCVKNESCSAKLNSSEFVPGLKLKSWVAIDKVHINEYCCSMSPNTVVLLCLDILLLAPLIALPLTTRSVLLLAPPIVPPHSTGHSLMVTSSNIT